MILKDGRYATGKFVPEGAIVVNTPRPTSAHSWDGSKWVFDGFSNEESMNALRFERNLKLAETDWMAGSDLTISDAWKTYRQALRDIPTASGWPHTHTWPTKPS